MENDGDRGNNSKVVGGDGMENDGRGGGNARARSAAKGYRDPDLGGAAGASKCVSLRSSRLRKRLLDLRYQKCLFAGGWLMSRRFDDRRGAGISRISIAFGSCARQRTD